MEIDKLCLVPYLLKAAGCCVNSALKRPTYAFHLEPDQEYAIRKAIELAEKAIDGMRYHLPRK